MATRIKFPAQESEQSRFFGEGLTFDDVLLMPAYSQVLPRETDLTTKLTNIKVSM